MRRRVLWHQAGIATEYVVLLILVALGVVLVLANYGGNVGNRVGAAGEKIDSIESRSDGTDRERDSSRRKSSEAEDGEEPPPDASGGDGRSRRAALPDSGDGGGAAAPEPGARTKQIVIGGIIVAAIGLLVLVRMTQRMQQAGEAQRQAAERAVREEITDDQVEDDTLSVKRKHVMRDVEPTDDE
ncbi:MAG: hypothetical protein ACREQ9_02785 [Candidatus Binatia bacterium]